jgi:hypothetical protein
MEYPLEASDRIAGVIRLPKRPRGNPKDRNPLHHNIFIRLLDLMCFSGVTNRAVVGLPQGVEMVLGASYKPQMDRGHWSPNLADRAFSAYFPAAPASSRCADALPFIIISLRWS